MWIRVQKPYWGNLGVNIFLRCSEIFFFVKVHTWWRVLVIVLEQKGTRDFNNYNAHQKCLELGVGLVLNNCKKFRLKDRLLLFLYLFTYWELKETSFVMCLLLNRLGPILGLRFENVNNKYWKHFDKFLPFFYSILTKIGDQISEHL